MYLSTCPTCRGRGKIKKSNSTVTLDGKRMCIKCNEYYPSNNEHFYEIRRNNGSYLTHHIMCKTCFDKAKVLLTDFCR